MFGGQGAREKGKREEGKVKKREKNERKREDKREIYFPQFPGIKDLLTTSSRGRKLKSQWAQTFYPYMTEKQSVNELF